MKNGACASGSRELAPFAILTPTVKRWLQGDRPETRLEGEPGTPEFLHGYAAAERASKDCAKGTFSDFIARFEDLDEYTDMAETTKAEYERKFRRIDKEWESAPIAGLTDIEFRQDLLRLRVTR